MEFKPCPFCGGEATTSEAAEIKPVVPGWGWVGCQHCRVFMEYINGAIGRKKAVSVWNRWADDGTQTD